MVVMDAIDDVLEAKLLVDDAGLVVGHMVAVESVAMRWLTVARAASRRRACSMVN